MKIVTTQVKSLHQLPRYTAHRAGDEQTRDIPGIFLSALDDVFDKVEAFAAGGVDYITKPFQSAEVVARVKTHLDLRDIQIILKEQNDRFQKAIGEREQAERRSGSATENGPCYTIWAKHCRNAMPRKKPSAP